MIDSGNTAKKKCKPRGRPFVKGDPRANLKGRPRSFDQLRAMAQGIAHEPCINKKGNVLCDPDGNPLTIAQAIMRQWAVSNEPSLQNKFVEIAFGKVPDKMEVTTIEHPPIKVTFGNYDPEATPKDSASRFAPITN